MGDSKVQNFRILKVLGQQLSIQPNCLLVTDQIIPLHPLCYVFTVDASCRDIKGVMEQSLMSLVTNKPFKDLHNPISSSLPEAATMEF